MAGKKVFFSIKNKIVFALITILISVTGFNITYSYLMFKGDKEAYIYENALRSSELANKNILDYIKQKGELLAKSKTVQNDDYYLTGELISSGNTFLFNYNDNSFLAHETRIKSLVQTHSKKIKKGIKIHPFQNYLLLILKQDNGYRFALINKEPITEMLAKDNIFKYIVADSTQSVFYGDKTLLPNFQKSVVNNSMQGSVPADSNGTSYLVSYTKIKKLGLTTFSYISQDSAFAIFKDIVYKNISFTVIILGLFLILSIFFTKKITTPILKLIDKTREIADGNFDGTIEVSTNDELKTLGASVNNMSSQIMKLLDEKQDMIQQLEIANEKLDEYNKNLEEIVSARTKELSEANNFITAMINSLDQGLFVFNKTKKCLDIFTKACEKMFNKIPGGLEVSKLLGLRQAETEAFDKWNDVLFSNMMPFESAKALGPKNVTHSEYGQYDFKYIDLDYYPMTNKDGQLENIVAVATDKTAEIEAQEKFKEKDAYVTMILNVIKNKKAFHDFLDEMNGMLDSLLRFNNFETSEDLSNTAMIAFHSMNGGYANYSIIPLVQVARTSESQIKSFLGNRSELEQLLTSLVNNFKKEQAEAVNQIETQIGATNNKVEIEKTELEELRTRLLNHEDPKTLLHEYFVKSKISSIFTPYTDLITKISKKLNKPMTPLFINGGDIRVDTSKIKEFSSALVHLFRNCMDHGIESTDTRVKAGKPEEGSINISCSLPNPNLLKIVVQDDGGGINVEKVRKILEEKGIDHQKLTDKETMMYIFKPDFSTAEALTELSGRGVGMSAIAQAVKNLDGELDIDSELGRGSKFIFELPLTY